eukprot:snap_masked-scaffold115_size343722-processed-gene-2.15 protein:Tk09715 transcript:snap_masked-scaffold115_size343722-processed-gene-2.15-mRNA-1 annotation:"hypothetical protein TcasGA2_TC013794"
MECAARLQPGLFYVGYSLTILGFLIVNAIPQGLALLHLFLGLGYLTLSTWTWNSMCSTNIFVYYFAFTIINTWQFFSLLYRFRPVELPPDLSNLYKHVLEPFGVSRIQFQKLTSANVAKIVTLHSGECYAVENMTKTDSLGILLTGQLNVITEKSFLHQIKRNEFIDSPEFECSSLEDTFHITICAAGPSKYISWDRSTLEYMFVKDPSLSLIFNALISQDITEKLFAMNNRLRMPDGQSIDIRLPGIASHLDVMTKNDSASNNHRSSKRNMLLAMPVLVGGILYIIFNCIVYWICKRHDLPFDPDPKVNGEPFRQKRIREAATAEAIARKLQLKERY